MRHLLGYICNHPYYAFTGIVLLLVFILFRISKEKETSL